MLERPLLQPLPVGSFSPNNERESLFLKRDPYRFLRRVFIYTSQRTPFSPISPPILIFEVRTMIFSISGLMRQKINNHTFIFVPRDMSFRRMASFNFPLIWEDKIYPTKAHLCHTVCSEKTYSRLKDIFLHIIRCPNFYLCIDTLP